MTLETRLTHSREYLEQFRPDYPAEAWHFVASGLWSESPYHAGTALYEITKNLEMNTWVIISTALIDPEDEEEDERSLPVVPQVIAICRDAPEDATVEEMTKDMYGELWDIGLGLEE